MTLLSELHAYCRETWRRRYFWLSLARLDLCQRYHGSALGIAWSMLHPLCMTAILCVVFVGIFKADPRTYVPFLLCGLAAWSFISNMLLEGCLSIRQAEKFMRVYPAPILIYALRTLCALAFHFLVILLMAVVFSCGLTGFANLATLPFLLPGVILFLLFGLAVILIVGILDAYFPDNKHIVQVGLQMLFYTLPIIYPPEALRNELFRAVINYNPFAAFVLLIREPIAEARVPALSVWALASATTIVALLAAVVLVRRTERRIIFHL